MNIVVLVKNKNHMDINIDWDWWSSSSCFICFLQMWKLKQTKVWYTFEHLLTCKKRTHLTLRFSRIH